MSSKEDQTELEMESHLQAKTNRPSYLAYQVTQLENRESKSWTKIGVGFLHRDGGGLNILLDCLPKNGRITLRARPYREEGE
ncbi:hypothetical protein QEH59_14655 [Coraliomargarita sp. SDUM461004]|uniref:Uncharacterized protein n=1 Tax=Thalassobacterium sedimentorum TaxID=3041258 RepID=A0ABU1ALI7_9BACT|nr:hypothetical protein [Coraliomargarita sp. SDUM461004]MDQ8195672.1 hypothetical protein [Coraliomargarita sp. SDUM461004]